MAVPRAVTFIASCYVMMLIRALAMFVSFNSHGAQDIPSMAKFPMHGIGRLSVYCDATHDSNATSHVLPASIQQ